MSLIELLVVLLKVAAVLVLLFLFLPYWMVIVVLGLLIG